MSTLWESSIIGQNTAVINAAIALSNAGNGTYIFLRTTDSNILECNILHHSTINCVEEGMGEARNELCAPIERTAEGLSDGGGAIEVERSSGSNLIM